MDRRGEPTWQFNVCPRWLLYSGLPQVLGPTIWAVFRALIELDHQTTLLDRRRHGKSRQIFAAPHADLVEMTGLCERTIRRAMGYLASTSLISHYRPGTARKWSHFTVHVGTLIELYRYVAPRLRPLQGGIAGLERKELPDDGIRIYGIGDRGVYLRWEDLSVIQVWSDPTIAIDRADLGQVREICGMPVESERLTRTESPGHPDTESA